ncbi:MAG: hypothetical protein H6739_22135 [Alphaproteobacteria bacterium]|nr:hypothetical protein [Alphaproteobacteria bacterium]
MSEIESYAESAELGAVERLIPLDGELSLPDGGFARPHLAQTDRGLWLVAVQGEQGVHFELSRNPSLRYESRVFGDRVQVDGRTLGVPMGKGADARVAVGLGRLKARARAAVAPPAGRYVDSLSPLEVAFLDGFLGEGERALAWLEAGSELPVDSTVVPPHSAPARFLLTTERAALVAVGPLGDAAVQLLPTETLVIEKLIGRARVGCGEVQWLATLTNAPRYAELARLPAAGRAERLRDVARRNLHDYRAVALALVTLLEAEGDPQDALLAAMVRGEPAGGLLGALPHDEATGRSLARSLERWSFEHHPVMQLVIGGVDADPAHARWLLPVHRLAHRLALQHHEGPASRVRADIALAEHLILAGEHEEAARLLEAALAILPDEQLSDLLPPDDADLTAGEAGQVQRIRILELLVCARGDPDHPDPDTVVALARLQPLVPARIEDLLRSEDLTLRDRAARVLAVHKGLQPPAEAERPFAPRCIPETLVTERLQHPAAREEGVLGWLQGWLAKQGVPDRDALKSYCEPVSPRRHPAAVAALSDGAMALGMAGLEAYVSHGTLGTGLRAYEDDPSYLLIGGQHLYDDTEVYLGPAELRFAVGAELGHLRFKHTRVTGGEVWDGAVDKLRRLFDVTATALTLGSYAPVGRVLGSDRAYRIVSSVFSADTLQRIYQVEDGTKLVTHVGGDVGRLFSAGAGVADKAKSVTDTTAGALDKARGVLSRPTGEGSVGVRQAELIAAHRVMQLTADRAGLVLCGDLNAALRAIFLTDRQLRAELPIAERHGLAAALSRRGPDGAMLHQDVAVRVAALLSFYLSEDYAALREALGEPAGEE